MQFGIATQMLKLIFKPTRIKAIEIQLKIKNCTSISLAKCTLWKYGKRMIS